VSGVLNVRVTEDLVLDGGTWELVESQEGQPVARIAPPANPMFLQVVEYLETKPVPQGGNLRRDGESRAAVAVCLRWGSYFALLADPTRPSAPDIDDERTSQIADGEMARMNIEISAGIAWWLTLRGSDERRHWDLVHRALAYLPMGPKTVRGLEGCERLSGCASPEMVAAARSTWPAGDLDQALVLAERCGIRAIANTITLYAWRNGPVEDVHAGWADGYELGAWDRRGNRPRFRHRSRQQSDGWVLRRLLPPLLRYFVRCFFPSLVSFEGMVSFRRRASSRPSPSLFSSSFLDGARARRDDGQRVPQC
jgi:hypothetical protein